MIEYIKRLAGPYSGTGLRTFSFGFKTLLKNEIYVAVSATKEGFDQTTLTLDVDYTVSLNSDQEAAPGGSITLIGPHSSGLANGQILVIGSDIDYNQITQLTNYTRFPPEIINKALDRIVMQIQQIVERQGRTITVPATSSETPEEFLRSLFEARDDAAESAKKAEESAQVAENVREKVEEYSWDLPHVVDNVQQVEQYPHDGYFWIKGYGDTGAEGEDISNRVVKGRTLGERFADVVNVKDFGAVGDGVHDDTDAIQTAFNIGAATGRQVYIPYGVYIIGSAIEVANTLELNILADEATIKLVSPNSIRYAIGIFPSDSVSITGMRLDANRNSYQGLYIHKENREVVADCVLENVKVENVYRAGTQFVGGDGIFIDGEFVNVRMLNPVVKNCTMAANAGVMGSQGIFGITVSRLSKEAGQGIASDNVYIENPYIENVYCEDVTYIHDQDGIRCFSNYSTEGGYNPDTFSIIGGVFKNIRGRAIKGQTFSCYISGGTVIYTTATGFSGVLANKNAIDMQVGGGNISNLTFFCDGVVTNTLVRMDVFNDTFSKNVSGNVSNIRAVISGMPVNSMNGSYAVLFKNAEEFNTESKTANVNNITIESNDDFKSAIAVNTGSSDESLNLNATNISCPVSYGLVLCTGQGKSVINVANAINTGNSIVEVCRVNKPDIQTYNAINAVEKLKISKEQIISAPIFISKGGVEGKTYGFGSTDVLVVSRDGGAASLRILGGGDYYGSLYLGSQNSPNLTGLISSATQSATPQLTTRLNGSNHSTFDSTSFRPYTTGVLSLGKSSTRWSQLFADTSEINTSDEREKHNIESINEAVMRAWSKVNFCQFQFKDAVEKKGMNARVHFGVIAQRVKAAFESEGIDAFRYGLLCYDKWDDEYEEDEKGNKVLVTKAGDRYGIRYEEALALECAYQRWELQRIKNRLGI